MNQNNANTATVDAAAETIAQAQASAETTVKNELDEAQREVDEAAAAAATANERLEKARERMDARRDQAASTDQSKQQTKERRFKLARKVGKYVAIVAGVAALGYGGTKAYQAYQNRDTGSAAV